MTLAQKKLARFKWVWEKLEDKGYVDGYAGCQCRRIHKEWKRCNKPHKGKEILRLILRNLEDTCPS